MAKCPLPEYKEKLAKLDEADEKLCRKTKKESSSVLKYPHSLLVLSFLFFVISSGTEGFFISQSYTFGICGPHKMIPTKVLKQKNHLKTNRFFRLHL
jgi:hypothetical protein